MSFLKFAVVLAAVCSCHAYIYSYNDESLPLGHLKYRRVGMFAPGDAPHAGAPGNDQSYVKVNVTLHRESPNPDGGSIELALVHSESMAFVGFLDENHEHHFCCTEDFLHVSGCSEDKLGRLIVGPGAPIKPRVYDSIFPKDRQTKKLNHAFDITTSGRYYLLFSSCLQSTGDVSMSGEIAWMNPFGYLPGELYPYIPLFGNLAMGYLILSIAWFAMYMMNRSEILNLQRYISVVIALGLFETLSWYLDYRNFNATGVRPVWPILTGVLLSSVKRTLSRLLMLVVCMGYGVIKTSLTTTEKRKALALGAVYFCFSSFADVLSSYSQMTSLAVQRARPYFLIPVAVLDAVFYLWILQELYTSLTLLSERKQTLKLSLYKRFWWILIVTGVFSVMWVLLQVFVASQYGEDERWTTMWAFEGAWHITYFVILVAIAVLFRPSSHAQYYAFSEQISATDDDDIELENQLDED